MQHIRAVKKYYIRNIGTHTSRKDQKEKLKTFRATGKELGEKLSNIVKEHKKLIIILRAIMNYMYKSNKRFLT
jgi:hypothetical protein